MNSNIIDNIANSVQQQEIKAAMQEIVDMAKELHKMIEVTVVNSVQDYTIALNPRFIVTIEQIQRGDTYVSQIVLSDGRDLLVRESKEELGIDFKDKDFCCKNELINDKGWSFEEIYVAFTNVAIKDIMVQKDEVEEVKWISYSDFVKLLYSNDFVPHAKEYKDLFCQIIKQTIANM